MRTFRFVALGLCVTLLPGWLTRGGGGLAIPTTQLINSIGFNTHISLGPSVYTAAAINADMAYLGVHNIRDIGIFRDFGDTEYASVYNAVAAAGGIFDMLQGTGWSSCGANSTASYLSTFTGALDTFIASNPGGISSVEGPNEINNQPVCYLNTATATGASGAVINFTATLASVRAVVKGGYGSGMTVTDVTTPGAIPSSTTVLSATATNVTLSASTTVSNGDTIQFEANETNPASGVAWQQDIYNAVHADANLSGIPVLNFTDYPGAGVIGSADLNNAHIYASNGVQPGNAITGLAIQSDWVEAATIPNLSLLVTETGYYSNIDNSAGVDTTTQAIYELNTIFDLNTSVFTTPHLYFYILIDGGDGFGLFDSSNNPKTTATAIKNLVTIMSDGGGAFTPQRLNYTVTGLPAVTGSYPLLGAGGYAALFQKSNGNFFIPVWNEAYIWDAATGTENTPPTSTVTVTFGRTFSTVNVYDPMIGSSPQNTLTNVSSATLSMIKDPQILELIP